jgi:adenylate cyclase
VLEGSVRKAGNRVRVTAQLIEARTGNHIWAERYDRELADIFEVQDEITRTIVTALSPAFTSAELRRVGQKRPENMDSWDLTLQAMQLASELTKESLARARELAERAAELDPHNSQALATVSWCIGWSISLGFVDDPAAEIPIGMAATERALQIDPTDATALRTRSGLLQLMQRYEEALAAARECVRQNENYAHGWGVYGLALGWTGSFDEAVEACDRALLLSPGDPILRYWFDFGMAFIAFYAGRHEEGLQYAQGAVAANRQYGSINPHRLVAGHLAALGRIDEAKATVARILDTDPGMTLKRTREQLRVWNDETLDRYIEALRAAGVPEE